MCLSSLSCGVAVAVGLVPAAMFGVAVAAGVRVQRGVFVDGGSWVAVREGVGVFVATGEAAGEGGTAVAAGGALVSGGCGVFVGSSGVLVGVCCMVVGVGDIVPVAVAGGSMVLEPDAGTIVGVTVEVPVSAGTAVADGRDVALGMLVGVSVGVPVGMGVVVPVAVAAGCVGEGVTDGAGAIPIFTSWLCTFDCAALETASACAISGTTPAGLTSFKTLSVWLY